MTADSRGRAAPIRRRFVVHGHVQGVFFRASTKRAAEEAGATGWVRNEADGGVLAEVQGTPAAVAAVEAFLHRGPARARVRQVEATDVQPVEGETTFEVSF